MKGTGETSANFNAVGKMMRHGSVPFFQGTCSSSSVSMTREPSPALMSITRTRKKTRNVPLPPDAHCRIVSMEPEQFIKEVRLSSIVELVRLQRKRTRRSCFAPNLCVRSMTTHSRIFSTQWSSLARKLQKGLTQFFAILFTILPG